MSKVYDFVSLDIETLGLTVNSSVVQVGICLYIAGEYRTDSVLVKPDYKRSDKETLAWWQTQPHGDLLLRDAMILGADTLDEANEELVTKLGLTEDAVRRLEHMEWWFRGPHFDEVMIRHQIGEKEVNWKFYNVRCQRTLEKTVVELGYSLDDILAVAPAQWEGEETKHDAGYDAFMQARSVVGCKTLLQLIKAESKSFQASNEATVEHSPTGVDFL